MLQFFYDEDGRPMAFCYDRTDYYTYLLNLQGDVIAILDSNYNVVVEYTYSAYGQVMSVTGSLASTIGQINPLRYRGYYYDVETGFYYLNSRYYDPVVGRFLNPDSLVASTGDDANGLNMYAYCFNNPVNMSDSTGNWPQWVEDAWNSVAGWVSDTFGAAIRTTAVEVSYTEETDLFFGKISYTESVSKEVYLGDDKPVTAYADTTQLKAGISVKSGNASVDVGIGGGALITTKISCTVDDVTYTYSFSERSISTISSLTVTSGDYNATYAFELDKVKIAATMLFASAGAGYISYIQSYASTAQLVFI